MNSYILCVFLLLAILTVAYADLSCYFGDGICKSVTCRSCKVATCITGDCVCTLCD